MREGTDDGSAIGFVSQKRDLTRAHRLNLQTLFYETNPMWGHGAVFSAV